MKLGDKIKQFRLEKKLTMQQLADLSGKSKGYISMLEKGINPQTQKPIEPSLEAIQSIAKSLNVDLEDLISDTEDVIRLPKLNNPLVEKIANTVRKLNKDNQSKTYQYTKNLLHFQNRTVQEVSIKYKSKELTEILVTEKVAAGIGYSYGNNEVTSFYTDRDDLMQHDMATRVFGDSMEPELLDGDIILLKQGYDNVNGDIYVIDYDGKSYVKKLYNDGNRFVLKSINKKYSDIIIYTSDIQDTYFNIVGKVVDSFTPVEK
jgi:predicted transcriptional regulator|nr:MAG TPA: Repressor protein CI [Caudoviricetes sp.]